MAQKKPSATKRSHERHLSFEDRDHSICVEARGVETGDARFPRRPSWTPRPTASGWRNNLTALSQHRNLYFVAYQHQVYVYQPTARGQSIGSTPAIILTPIVKNPTAAGHINSLHPNDVNNLLVGELGSEEILVLVTDAGNVTAYRTEPFFKAIEEKGSNPGSSTPKALGAQLEPFFLDWVGKSAWGVAIHKIGRLIAVSSNTSCITVFAFALAEPAANGDTAKNLHTPRGETLEWTNISLESQYSVLRRLKLEQRRARNVRMTLTTHTTNIPNIGFLNSDLDSEGNWLLSTDIDNKLCIWSIWEYPTPVRMIDIRRDPTIPPRHIIDSRQMGWNVLAIDPRDVRPRPSFRRAFGGSPQRAPNAPDVYDSSHLAEHIPNSSRRYFTRLRHFLDNWGADGAEQGDSSDETFSMGSDFDTNPGAESPLESVSQSSPTRIPQEEGRVDPFADFQPSNERAEAEDGGAIPEEYRDSEIDTNDVDSVANSLPTIPVSWPSVQGEPRSIGEPSVESDSEYIDNLLLSSINTEEDLPSNYWSENSHSDVEDQHEDEHEDEHGDQDGDEDEDEDVLPDDNGADDDDDDDEDDYYVGEDSFPFDRTDPLNYEIFESLRQHSLGGYALGDLFPDISGWLADSEPERNRPPIFGAFPILHFSEIDIRLFAHPFAKRSALICRNPLAQDINDAQAPGLTVSERYNIVQQIPELGIVVAAVQNGRVGIFALTGAPEGETFFKLEYIVPFASQERLDERPLFPLLGIAVGPVEAHLAPLDEDSSESSSQSGDSVRGEDEDTTQHTRRGRPPSKKDASPRKPKDPKSSNHHLRVDGLDGELPLKREAWQGTDFSRRYRLFLMYADHTVMHYELFYDWPADMLSPRARIMHEPGRGFVMD
ncbi:hypothetical protein FQN50_006842 [Emmonsiellopsis sp. PD_5]|nr:hypothetical protein FQN50_006842 [Emmonsiellopsis sp. PD_5]